MNAIQTRWIIGIAATIGWFWGEKMGIPPAGIALCSSIVPGLIGHALGGNNDPKPGT